jgi:thiol-disulfide isomerase/thioredoxin
MKRRIALSIACCLLVPFALTGCQPGASPAVAEESPQQKGAPAKGDKIPLELASWDETEKIVASYKGKVVVLDIWSTWCEPCVREFPGLVELQKKHPNDVVSVSLNSNYIGVGSAEDEKDDILAFLKKQDAQIRNLISTDADEDLYKKVGIASIPVARVYGRDGKLVKQFDNEKGEYGDKGFNYEEHVGPLVEKLVKEK